MARLSEKYKTEIVDHLKQKFEYDNVNAVPKLQKIVITMGMGNADGDKTRFETAQKQLSQIAGQHAVVVKARKSVSNFKLREGMNIGLMVTLRGSKMYDFLDRLISLALPRVKDFRGVKPSSFDGRGNYNMGLTEQLVFPEIDPNRITFVQGMNIAFATTAKSDAEARELLEQMGMPFRKD